MWRGRDTPGAIAILAISNFKVAREDLRREIRNIDARVHACARVHSRVEFAPRVFQVVACLVMRANKTSVRKGVKAVSRQKAGRRARKID